MESGRGGCMQTRRSNAGTHLHTYIYIPRASDEGEAGHEVVVLGVVEEGHRQEVHQEGACRMHALGELCLSLTVAGAGGRARRPTFYIPLRLTQPTQSLTHMYMCMYMYAPMTQLSASVRTRRWRSLKTSRILFHRTCHCCCDSWCGWVGSGSVRRVLKWWRRRGSAVMCVPSVSPNHPSLYPLHPPQHDGIVHVPWPGAGRSLG